jgi:hypothetical protein
MATWCGFIMLGLLLLASPKTLSLVATLGIINFIIFLISLVGIIKFISNRRK